MVICKFAKQKFVHLSQPNKDLWPATDLHNRETIIMPVNDELGVEASQHTDYHAHKQKRNTWWVLYQNYVVSSSEKQDPKQLY
jgi:hypothetical protein